MNSIALNTASSPKTVDSDSDTVQETKCTKIPAFLNRFKNKDGAKANNPGRDKRVLRVFIRFRHWSRKKRKVKMIEKYRSEPDCTDPQESKFKMEWENILSRHHGRMRLNRKRKGGSGVALEDGRHEMQGLPMRSRIKTRFAKIMRRRRRRSTATNSFFSVHCSHSRRSVDLKKQNFAVEVIMRPLAKLKTRKSKRVKSDYSDGDGKPSKRSGKARKHVTPAVEKCRRWLDEYSPPSGSKQVDVSHRCALSEPFVYPRTRKNFKQKFFRVLKKFKKAGVMEHASIAKKLSSGDTGALDVIEDLMDKLSIGKSSQYFEDIVESLNDEDDDSLSIITQAKPTLKPYFTENKLLWPNREDYCETSSSSPIPVLRSTTIHRSYLN